jgi:hypothetical protein
LFVRALKFPAASRPQLRFAFNLLVGSSCDKKRCDRIFFCPSRTIYISANSGEALGFLLMIVLLLCRSPAKSKQEAELFLRVVFYPAGPSI